MGIDEVIGIEVGFWGARIVPIRFVWNGKRHEVKRVAMEWERKDGGKNYLCFAVDTGRMVAELAWDIEGRTWRISQCEPSFT